MKFPILNLINALVLMTVSLWMFRSSLNPSIIHLLPFMVGIVLLALNNGIKEGAREQKKVAGYISILISIIFGLLLWQDNVYKEEGFLLLVMVIFSVSLMSSIVFLLEKNKT